MQLRRERIAERMRALQELVPNTNKVILFVILLGFIIRVKTSVVHMLAIEKNLASGLGHDVLTILY